MTPKEKAEQLYDKFHVWDTMSHNEVKTLTLIAVNEIIDIYWNLPGCGIGSKLEYWKKVKREIEKL